MSSFYQIIGMPEIPVYEIQRQTDEQQHSIYKQITKLYKRRMKLWDKKAREYEHMDLGTKELLQKRIVQYYNDPHLKFIWQHQWWNLSKKNFKKFKWFLI